VPLDRRRWALRLGLGLLLVVAVVLLVWLVPPLLYRSAGGAGPDARLGAITTTRTAFITASAALIAGLIAGWSVYVNTRNLKLGQHTLEVNQEANRRNLEATHSGQLTDRYASAAEQLGHEKPAVRLAGVYAMARLADDWEPQRQPCIDVLCAYLRMPYEPETAPTGEREVRLTVIRLIRDHLRPIAAVSWQGRDLDFTGATFDGGDFTGATFRGGQVNFTGATFSGGEVNFFGAEFSGGRVNFYKAEFSGGRVSFTDATFNGGEVSFTDATFNGGEVSFTDATFNGGEVNFTDATFNGGRVSFTDAEFSGGSVSFADAEFNGGQVDFGQVATWDTPARELPAAAPGLVLPVTS